MAKPKYDYDGDKFYERLEKLATAGWNDSEIAELVELDESVFSRMRNGKYEGWTKKENEVRSARISQVLARGRKKIIELLRSSYLRTALGQSKTKSVTKKFVEELCECGGDPTCPICGGTGKVVRSDKWVTLETETQMAPSLQAMTVLLYHHDPEWRAQERLKDEVDDVPKAKQGISIEDWINGKIGADETETENEQ